MSSYTDVGEEQGYLLHKYAKSGNKKQVKKILNNGKNFLSILYLVHNEVRSSFPIFLFSKIATVDILVALVIRYSAYF